MGHLNIEGFELVIPKIDLALNYGEEFLKIHETILKKLNDENGKGIVLLHGEPGTGKTTYIKYLTGLISNKEIIFVPPSMAESLSDPAIVPFLMEHKNSILIIEDAENVISDRRGNVSSAGVSNILNITDGILGECLNIQIIATFNMNKEKIDNALLRKGRLIAEHKFDKLSVENTNKLLHFLNKTFISEENMSLADIYNVDVELLKSKDKTSKIGFYANKK
jgi:ATP-dependent 26S proteasome regulatory subunit